VKEFERLFAAEDLSILEGLPGEGKAPVRSLSPLEYGVDEDDA